MNQWINLGPISLVWIATVYTITADTADEVKEYFIIAYPRKKATHE